VAGFIGGAKALYDLLNSVISSRPRLKGTIQKIRQESDPTEIVGGGPYGWICAFVGVVNTRKANTTIPHWQLHVSFETGFEENIEAGEVDDFWDRLREESRPADTGPLSLGINFEFGIYHKGWLYFPCGRLDDIQGAYIVAIDAFGRSHKLEWE